MTKQDTAQTQPPASKQSSTSPSSSMGPSTREASPSRSPSPTNQLLTVPAASTAQTSRTPSPTTRATKAVAAVDLKEKEASSSKEVEAEMAEGVAGQKRARSQSPLKSPLPDGTQANSASSSSPPKKKTAVAPEDSKSPATTTTSHAEPSQTTTATAKPFGSGVTTTSFAALAKSSTDSASASASKPSPFATLATGGGFGGGIHKGGFGALASANSASSAAQNGKSIWATATEETETSAPDTGKSIFAQDPVDKLGASSEVPSTPPPQKTGEEDEMTLFRSRVSCQKLDREKQEWKQRGKGPIHVNVHPKLEQARIVLRNAGTWGVILNCLIFPQMTTRLVQEKTLILGIIEDGHVVSYAIRCESAAVAEDLLQIIEDLKTPDGMKQVLLEREAIDAWELMRSEQAVHEQQSVVPADDGVYSDDDDAC